MRTIFAEIYRGQSSDIFVQYFLNIRFGGFELFCSQNYKKIGAVKPYAKWTLCNKAQETLDHFTKRADVSGSTTIA